jgi:hypothetical protein
MLKKKICANFQRIIELFTQNIVSKLSKIWVWDPGSEILDPGSGKNLLRIPDPGVKKAPDPGSGSATLKQCAKQCWGSVTFWCGSGFPDRYLCLMDPAPALDPDPTPDPTPFLIDFTDAKKIFLNIFFL